MFCNIIITGLGFLNRIREVAPKGAESYLAVDLALMEGEVKDGDFSGLRKTYLSAVVKGADAIEIIRNNFTDSEGKVTSPDRVPVRASVSLGGLQPDSFTYSKGERAGQTGINLRTTLLKISWLKIGDTVVVGTAAANQEESGDATTVPSADEVQSAAEGVTPEVADAPTPAAEPETAQETDSEPAFAGELQAAMREGGAVSLDPKHPEFQARKAYVKAQGMVWDRENQHWVMAATSDQS